MIRGVFPDLGSRIRTFSSRIDDPDPGSTGRKVLDPDLQHLLLIYFIAPLSVECEFIPTINNLPVSTGKKIYPGVICNKILAGKKNWFIFQVIILTDFFLGHA